MTATATAEQTLGTSRASSRHAFVALLRRDLTVLGKDKWMFLGRTIMQPLLLIFVFTYVFPKIGEGIGTKPSAFATLLVGGTIASAMIFQGVQAVALPLVQDFGYTARSKTACSRPCRCGRWPQRKSPVVRSRR